MGYTDAPPEWWRHFVLSSPARTAKLGVVRADGSPHVAPVWVDLDGDEIIFMTSADTIKGKAILRDPRVSLCWDDERPPFSFVSLAGTARTSTDMGDLLEWATRIGGRYMGVERAEEYGRRNAVRPTGSTTFRHQPHLHAGGTRLRDLMQANAVRRGERGACTDSPPREGCGQFGSVAWSMGNSTTRIDLACRTPPRALEQYRAHVWRGEDGCVGSRGSHRHRDGRRVV
jgi:PPOX class probable F420-dependent enzyme